MKMQKEWYLLDEILSVDATGYVNKTDYHPARRGVPYWILVIVDQGGRSLYANEKPLEIGARQFFLLPPNTAQKPLFNDTHVACFFHFYANGTAVEPPERISPHNLILPCCGYLPAEFDCFSHFRFLCEHAISPYADQSFLKAQLQALLSAISLQCQTHRHTNQKGVTTAEQILEFIKRNVASSVQAKQYEAEFALSYHQLNHIFKKRFGKTVKQYQMRLRMELAAQMLIEGNDLAKTALACGFEDYYFFINSFTKAHGVSPALFRKMHGA